MKRGGILIHGSNICDSRPFLFYQVLKICIIKFQVEQASDEGLRGKAGKVIIWERNLWVILPIETPNPFVDDLFPDSFGHLVPLVRHTCERNHSP